MSPYTQCVRKGILTYTELWVYGLYNDQYTYVSLYNCILACVDCRTQSVMRPYMYLLSELQTPMILSCKCKQFFFSQIKWCFCFMIQLKFRLTSESQQHAKIQLSTKLKVNHQHNCIFNAVRTN